ncbi:MAG: 1-deoxy-D-xylulose-5-phosphate synthase [Candidatus Omnitrophota bacterium]|nr:1-deoxy-D-xylulose-5-phosphate synthase [Candidatus Omnitrophota bacterium]
MFLERINTPEDLRKLTPEELPLLAEEVRQRMISVVSVTGGHLASSLGSVEVILALHYCLNTPKDKIIFDVGHQAYAHKIITGRNKDFPTLRQYGGVSGFPSKEESAHDSFTTGHSSTAISLGLGLACSQDKSKPEDAFKVAALIGDGSLSGGLCFEGLNNAGHLKKDLLVVLNTNELSIAPNVGALSTYINKIISLPIYNRFRSSFDTFMRSRVPRSSRILKLANKFEESLKGFFIPGMFFEELGFRYFGPLDGNNLHVLIRTLKNILHLSGPLLLHVVTKKGKGYLPAEENPVKFHSAAPFDIASGISTKPSVTTYTDIFSDCLVKLAKDDFRIVAITAAMPEGTGLDKFRDTYPERFFDVGIAEAHAVCFASGVANNRLKPVVAIYSTFLARAYDQIIECISLNKLPVVLIIDRAGIVGDDGVTHQGIFDITYLRSVPNLIIMAPAHAQELEDMLAFAVNQEQAVVIRYPKASCPVLDFKALPLELGKAQVLQEAKDYAILALGSMVSVCQQASKLLEKEGIKGTLVNARFVKPLDAVLFEKISREHKFIFTVEEGVIEAGFGSAVSECIGRPVYRLGLPSEFLVHGKREFLLDKYGLSPAAIAVKIKKELGARI